jgi:putative flavoprotein involved in K+ transport
MRRRGARPHDHAMTTIPRTQHIETIVIGGGQAGLAVGYHLRRKRLPFLIVDAHERIGDAWRTRWDSLRLFSPARFDGLDGMSFPAAGFSFITKDEMADYLEIYAAKFELPVRTNTRVERLWRDGGRFCVEAADTLFEADNVVVAMANYQRPRVPAFAAELAPSITQLHSKDYRNPSQLRPDPVLVVGLGNSGAEIALELSRSHRTYVSGRDTGAIPFRIDGLASRLFLSQVVFRGVFHRLLTVDTPIGRRVHKQHAAGHKTPLIRVRPGELVSAGVERLGRTVSVDGGLPLLDDGRTIEVANVIWCTGFNQSFEWIDLPVHSEFGPLQEKGICSVEPGLYFVGLHFQYALSSSMLQGVSRDAARVVGAIAQRAPGDARAPQPQLSSFAAD